MNFRAAIINPLLTFIFFTLRVTVEAQASPKDTPLLPQTIIEHEISLSKLQISIHRLRLDFLDQDARESLLQAQEALNMGIHALPESRRDAETNELLSSITSLWPVVNRHILWLSTVPASTQPPPVNALLRALDKMSGQLLLLRQKAANSAAGKHKSLRFLEQALLMQYITKDYLGLLVAKTDTEATMTSQRQLKELTQLFDRRIQQFNAEFSSHPHAMQPIKQAHAAWAFIRSSLDQYPKQQIPDLVVRYSHRIVHRLSSVHRMF